VFVDETPVIWLVVLCINDTLILFVRWYPDSCELATSLGLLYMMTEQNQRAFEKLGSALARDPACTRALLAAGCMMQVY